MADKKTRVTVVIGDEVYQYEFDSEPTQEQINEAIDTIGGRKKRRK